MATLDRRRLRNLVLLAVCAPVAAVCGGTSSSSGGASQSATGSVDKSQPLILSSFGGPYEDAIGKSFGAYFTEKIGVHVQLTGPPSVAAIKTQVQTHNVQWDVVDVSSQNYLQLVREGLLEPVNYSGVSAAARASTPAEEFAKYGYAWSIFALAIVYRTDKYPNGGPQNWADVWTVRKFPGPRSLRSAVALAPDLEAALLADGVPMSHLYPLDLNRAFKSLDNIKPYIPKFSDTSSQAASLLQGGDANIVELQTSRAFALKDQGVPVKVVWNQAQFDVDYFAIPKGAPHPAAAERFIQLATEATPQAMMADLQPIGPTNKAALASVARSRLAEIPTAHLEQGYFLNSSWWLSNAPGTNQANLEVISRRWLQWSGE